MCVYSVQLRKKCKRKTEKLAKPRPHRKKAVKLFYYTCLTAFFPDKLGKPVHSSWCPTNIVKALKAQKTAGKTERTVGTFWCMFWSCQFHQNQITRITKQKLEVDSRWGDAYTGMTVSKHRQMDGHVENIMHPAAHRMGGRDITTTTTTTGTTNNGINSIQRVHCWLAGRPTCLCPAVSQPALVEHFAFRRLHAD